MPLRRKNASSEVAKLGDHEMLLTVRTRFTAAQLVTTPGAVVLPATSRGRYRLVDAFFIAIGGVAGGLTSVNLVGTVNNVLVNLIVMAAAGLTQSTVLDMGTAGSVVLADGASYNLMDANTPINIMRVGAALTGATAIDVMLVYALESASMTSGL